MIIIIIIFLIITIILLLINLQKCCNNEKFINKSKYKNIKHFITNLNLYIPKNNKWNDDLISRWKNHEYKTNTEILNILNKIDDKSIIIEAGGHIGDTTFFMSTYLNNMGKKCLIYVFEPDITKCNYMQDIININKITNIKIFNVGISNKFLNGSLDKKAHAGAWTVKDGNDFKIIPLDSINYKYPVSFIKLDVEGFEYNALLGAKKIINMFNPILCIERENKEIKEFLTKNFKYNFYLKTGIDYFYNNIELNNLLPRSDGVVITVNNNPDYIKWIPLAFNAWNKINIYPYIFIIISENTNEEFINQYKKYIYSIIYIPKSWKTSSFAQVSRLFLPILLTQCENVMISNIDYIPLPSYYWNLSIGPKEKFIAMRKKNNKNFFMGFNTANPKTWKEIFEVKNKIKSVKDIVFYMKYLKDNKIWIDNNWGCDQIILQKQLEKFSDRVISFNEHVYRLTIEDNIFKEEPLWENKKQYNVNNFEYKLLNGKYIWLGPSPNNRIKSNDECLIHAKEYIDFGIINNININQYEYIN